MGLDTTHEAWHGAYSSFWRWRRTITVAAGYELDDDPRYPSAKAINWAAVTSGNLAGHWEQIPEDPLLILLIHSDCDGEILPEHAGLVADRLEQVMPNLPDGDEVERMLGWSAQQKTQQFIDGLREAAAAGEPLGFH